MTESRQKLDIKKAKFEPYTLNINDASMFFGLAPRTLYNWINNGKLIRSVHYLKVSNKPLIKREAFIRWMEEQDGCTSTG